MTKCIVAGCSSSTTKGDKVHNVPSVRKKADRKTWLSNVNRLDLMCKPQKIVVCNKHFHRKCYQKNLRVEYMEGKIQYDLVPGSVPTIVQRGKSSECPNAEHNGQPTRLTVYTESQLPSVPKKPLMGPSRDVLGDVTNTVLHRTSPAHPVVSSAVPRKMPRRAMVDVSTQTCYIAQHAETQTEDQPVDSSTQCDPASISIDHSYTCPKMYSPPRPKMSTPARPKMSSPARPKMSTQSRKLCELLQLDISSVHLLDSTDLEFELTSDESEMCVDDEKCDPTFEPATEEITSSSSGSSLSVEDLNESSFIVYGQCLNELLAGVRCIKCDKQCMITNTYMKGSSLTVYFQCSNFHDFQWSTQQSSGRFPHGNLQIAAAALFSGQNYSVLTQFAALLGLRFLHRTSYNAIQSSHLFRLVNDAWNSHQSELLETYKGKIVCLAGDGRCDSPGFSAKYGTYTVMDIQTNVILGFHVTQCTETSSSVHMEKHGLEKCLGHLQDNEITVDVLATDRHVQIRKYLTDKWPDINHQFDVWHLAKSVGKKLSKKSKQKGCERLSTWIKSVVNHLWWCCATCDGNGDVLVEKWLSIVHHVCNRHVFPGHHVTECCHGRLEPTVERKTKWLKMQSPEHQALTNVVTNKLLVKDIRQLTLFCHTGALESYHALLLKYMPKRIHYSLEGMIARTQLAALDHNHNVNRAQATVKTGSRKGEKRFRTEFSKLSKSWIAKKMYEKKSYEYLEILMEKTLETEKLNCTRPNRRSLPPNISRNEKPRKEIIVQGRVSRFGK
ncbi:uncharacterized protein LOC128207876 [Mya arenaria]|uniref:uncharacterized protein LOC128207876 n=1 Tax=Mya arenaria TaxID=6604 RepID=UPI0022E4B1AC|nr:uncharacterized protein LOC128207876 [Mya arenaria]